MPILVIWLDQRMSTPPYWNHWLHDIMQLMSFCAAKSLKRCITGASRSLAGELSHAAGQDSPGTIALGVFHTPVHPKPRNCLSAK